MKKRLTKSNTNVVLTGTLAGIGEFFGIDPTIIRVLYVILIFLGMGSPILLYILLAVLIPRNPNRGHYQYTDRQYGNPYGPSGTTQKNTKRKEAEKIDDDDWSDF